jgi:hypothetical protein
MRSDLHKELQGIAKSYAISKTFWVCGEEVPMPLGICDVWGMSRSWNLKTIAIEVKVSKADFRSSSQKGKENHPDPLANYQYIFCPANLIYPDDIHKEWGLLWWNGKRIINKKPAPELEMSAEQKLRILVYFLANGMNQKRPKLLEIN